MRIVVGRGRGETGNGSKSEAGNGSWYFVLGGRRISIEQFES